MISIVMWSLFAIVTLVYFFKEGITSFFALFSQNLETDDSFSPDISIVMAMRNEELIVEKAILNWIDTDYPNSKKEIVIADNSDDRTGEIVNKMAAERDDVKIVYFNPSANSKIGAIHEGIERASHEIVFICDADILVGQDCIKKALPYLANEKCGCVFGTRIPIYEDSFFKMMTGLRELYVSVQLQCFSLIDSTPWISLSPGVFRKTQLLESTQDFDPKIMADDLYMAVALRKNGYLVKYVPQITARAGVVGSFRDLWVQHFRGSQAVAQAIVRGYHGSLFLPDMYGSVVVPLKFFTHVISYTALPLFLIGSCLTLRFDLLLYYYLIMLFWTFTNYVSALKLAGVKDIRLLLGTVVYPIAYTIVELIWSLAWYAWFINPKANVKWKKTTSDRVSA